MSENAVDNIKVNRNYIIAMILMLFFIFNDLLFDFAFSFEASDYIAFGCTIISAIIVFVGNGKIRNDEYKNKFYETTKFIKSNFDNAQVIFSILDIVCGMISIVSSLFFLSYTFKIVKVFYVPTKILVVINKEKSLLKPITKFSYLWTSMRLLEKQGGNMVNFIKSNKYTLIFGVLISLFCGFTGYVAITAMFDCLPLFAVILISLGIAVGVFALIFFLGKDTVEGLALRLSKKVLPKEKYEQLIKVYNNAVEEVEKLKAEEDEKKKIEIEAKKQIIARKKEAIKAEEQKKTIEIDKAKAEFQAKVDARIAEIEQSKETKA